MNDCHHKEIKALNEKIKKLLQAYHKTINYVDESDEFQGYQ